MDFVFSKLFWGAIIIVLGLSIIIGSVFKINIPFFRILFSLFLIYLGVRMLVGSFKSSNQFGSYKDAKETTDVFTSNSHKPEFGIPKKEYSVVFGSQALDLRNIEQENDHSIEVSSVFGSQTVLLSKETPVRIKANAVFGNIQLPDGTGVSFGENTYVKSDVSQDSATPQKMLFIEANAVFSQINSIRK